MVGAWCVCPPENEDEYFLKMKICYPSYRSSEEAFGPQTLALMSAQVLSWRQGPGVIGGLHLHECWEDDSVLSRGYHGSTAFTTAIFLDTALLLAQNTGDVLWTHLADNLAAQLLWQQAPEGGFFFAAAEFEPAYSPVQSCPIHQMKPLLALLHYYEAKPSGTPVRSLLKNVAERHVEWFTRYWWRRGSVWSGPLEFPGWCGVTNQDLVVIAALARYGQVFGDWEPFEKYGLSALETYLGPRYFDVKTGLFWRGDSAFLTERCNYMVIILAQLRQIEALCGDKRLPPIIERVEDVLAQAAFCDAQGNTCLSWGADDKETARLGRLTWDKAKTQLGFGFIHALRHHPEIANAIEQTLAGLVFADGTFAGLPSARSPLFAVVPSAWAMADFWRFLAKRNPQGVGFGDLPSVPSVIRRYAATSFSSWGTGWVIREQGEVRFRGVKCVAHGVLKAEQTLPNFAFHEPEADFREEILL